MVMTKMAAWVASRTQGTLSASRLACPPFSSASLGRNFRLSTLIEVVESVLALHTAAQAQHVRRCPRRIELHEVAAAVPEVACVGQQVVHLITTVVFHAERGEIDVDPSRLGGPGV